MTRIPGHAFNRLPILHDRPLLEELKKLVTLEPTEGVMTESTGIPPHVNHSRVLKLVIDNLSRLQEMVSLQGPTVIEAMKKCSKTERSSRDI